MTDMYAERERLARQRMDLPGLKVDVHGVGETSRGASLAVWAIREGRDASATMHKYSKVDAAATKVAS